MYPICKTQKASFADIMPCYTGNLQNVAIRIYIDVQKLYTKYTSLIYNDLFICSLYYMLKCLPSKYQMCNLEVIISEEFCFVVLELIVE